MRKTKAAFLDRDGTINKNYGYVIDKKKIKFLKNVVPSIKLLNKKKFLVYKYRLLGLFNAYVNKKSWYRPKI